MNSMKMPKLKIGELEAKIPIIQGGMSVGISLAGLASAVAKLGAIGVIGAAGIGMLKPDEAGNYKEMEKKALTREIRKAKKMTDGIIGVNIMVALTDCEDLIMISVDEGVDLIFIGAGLLLRMPKALPPDRLGEIATKFVPIVSSARAMKIIFKYWAKNFNHIPDAVVVEGPLAGGHLGFKKEQINNPDYTLEKILSDVVNEIKPFEQQFSKNIPIIAAGGIYTGEDIYKVMQLGAQGVQMATRFVATSECDASIEFKEAYIKCKKEDIITINSPVGMPGRAIRNQYLKDVSMGIRKPFKCPWKCLKTCEFRKAPYCIALALTNAQKGNLEEGFAFAGADAYRVDKIISVKELIDTLLEEYNEAVCSNGDTV